MKTTIKIITLIIATIAIMYSCTREDKVNDNSIITPVDITKSDFDKWIESNFIDTYNVNLLYKYDDTKTDQNDHVVPVDSKKAIQMANIIKYLFFDAFKKHTPKNFLQKYCPKAIMLIGSGAYNGNGTVKLGLAENGVQFSLYDVNSLDLKNINSLYDRYFRTIYHEFSHILHQTIDYSQDFKKISAKDYVSDSWNEEWKKKSSLEAGFISDYSTKDSNEDFVELIAHYLTYSPEVWKAELEKAAGKDGDKPGKSILDKKIALVLSYMKTTWNIDLNKLRDEIQTRAENMDGINFNELK